jgi:hypothetical protein
MLDRVETDLAARSPRPLFWDNAPLRRHPRAEALTVAIPAVPVGAHAAKAKGAREGKREGKREGGREGARRGGGGRGGKREGERNREGERKREGRRRRSEACRGRGLPDALRVRQTGPLPDLILRRVLLERPRELWKVLYGDGVEVDDDLAPTGAAQADSGSRPGRGGGQGCLEGLRHVDR